jgi:hypothetical protein
VGYTRGRKHTDESLIKLALNYDTKSALQTADPSAYVTLRRRGLLNKACSHMKSLSFSIPQLLSKSIFDALLDEDGKYNDRSTIGPLELDVFYPKHRFAVEYRGKRWHEFPDMRARDSIKEKICSDKGIGLFVIVERSRNYEDDIKDQIISALPKVIAFCRKDISELQVLNVKIDYQNAFKLFDKERIEQRIKTCHSIADFQKSYPHDYRTIRTMHQTDMLSDIRVHFERSDQELVDIAKKFTQYADFVKSSNGAYLVCRKRGILEIATSHMIRGRPRNFTEKYISNVAKTCASRGELKKKYPGVYKAARRMGLLSLVPRRTKTCPRRNSVETTGVDQEGTMTAGLALT